MERPDEPTELSIEDSLDLHTFAPHDVADVVDEYLRAARAAGFREIRLIHGRGRGVQRAAVHNVIARLPWVVRAYEAPADRGGWGATVVILDALDRKSTLKPD
jgi:dsDNA-specific endonuclease/ATPase MutS2